MKTKIIDIKIFDESERDIYQRWAHFLGNYRKQAKDRRRAAAGFKVAAKVQFSNDEDFLSDAEFDQSVVDDDQDVQHDDCSYDHLLRGKDRVRIGERAKKLADFRKAVGKASHLRADDLNRIRVLQEGVRLAVCESESQADEMASLLHSEAPWMGPASEYVWLALRRSAKVGEPISFQPAILNGPPGIGKSHWCRALARVLDVPYGDLDASKNAAGFNLIGSERAWSGSAAGRPLEIIIQEQVANPLIVIDEICKAKSATSSNSNTTYSFSDSLLSLLEPANSKRWECPYYRLTFDMSHVLWILTANNVSKVSEPVRSRCQIIQIADLTSHQLRDFAEQEAKRKVLSKAATDAALEALERSSSLLRRRLSLRDVRRAMDRAESLENRPRSH